MTAHHLLRRALRIAPLASAALVLASGVARSQQPAAQDPGALPFGPGERLEYSGRVHVGVSGGGTLWIEGPSDVRGTATWTLHSDMEGRVGFIRASDKNASWLDPVRFTSLRYTSRERHLLARHDDAVEIFGPEKRWSSQSGASGTTDTEFPLDELSFLYFLRTLPLHADTTLTFSRHFDATRNPTIVTVVGREDIEVESGRFHAVLIEMRVRDTRRYKGEGVIRIALSDDRCRLLLRLESDTPDAGKAVIALKAFSGTRCDCTSQLRPETPASR
jgi:hypothetical protein